VWYPTIQFTFKMYDGASKQTTWKSINVTNFAPLPDRRSCKADEFSFTFRPGAGAGAEDAYAVTAKLGDDVQVSLTVSRPAGVPGFKLGGGPTGGYSLFGPDGTLDPAKAEGYVVHRFWPRTRAAGLVVTGGHARTLDAAPGMFVHAIQGMRPNLVASRWNFAHFQAPGGAAAVQMEFTTTTGHGRHGAGSGGVRVNIGALVLGDKLVAVTGETHAPDAAPDAGAEVQSRAEHLGAAVDADTGYAAPTGLLYTWAAPSAIGGSDGPVKAVLQVDVGGPAKAEAKGLVEKVDILAEIPWVIRKAVNYAAGTKPFIYQVNLPCWLSADAATDVSFSGAIPQRYWSPDLRASCQAALLRSPGTCTTKRPLSPSRTPPTMKL
jgi:hypothetical protein